MDEDTIIKYLKHKYVGMKQRDKYRSINLSAKYKTVSRDYFISWTLGSNDFFNLYDTWIKAGKDRKLCPTVDRIDNNRGYEEGNMQWITHSENSRKRKLSYIPEKKTTVVKNTRKKENKLDETLAMRVTPYEKNFIRGLADLYANGNLSAFLIYAAFNCDRKYITKEDLLESERRIRKGRKPLLS